MFSIGIIASPLLLCSPSSDLLLISFPLSYCFQLQHNSKRTDRHTDRHTDGHTDRHTDRRTDRQTDMQLSLLIFSVFFADDSYATTPTAYIQYATSFRQYYTSNVLVNTATIRHGHMCRNALNSTGNATHTLKFRGLLEYSVTRPLLR